MFTKRHSQIRGACVALVAAVVVITVGLAAPATVLAGDAHAAAGSGGHADATVDRVLAQGAGYRSGGSIQVRRLQRQLRNLEYRPGPIDGRFGPLTGAAVSRFQQNQGLAVDGLVGQQTRLALRQAARRLGRGAGYAEPQGSARVRALQLRLRAAGQHPGAIDGRFGPRTESAVRRFQRRQGLSVDGLVGQRTDASLRRELQQARSKPQPQPQPEPQPARDVRPAPLERSSNPWRPGLGVVLPAAVALLAGILVLAWPAWRRRRARRGVDEPVVAPAGRPRALPLDARLRGTPAPVPDRVEVVGYACAANGENGPNGDELRTQAETIARECKRRGLVLLEIVPEPAPVRGRWVDRPGLGYALRRIADGDARGLVVAKLTAVGRSVGELGEVLEWFRRSDARLVAVAQDLDTSQATGLVTARTLMTVGASERERRAEAQRKGPEPARPKGPPGVADNPELTERIARMRAHGMTLQAIADRRLDAEGVPTASGGAKWRPAGIKRAIGTRRAARRGERNRTDDGGAKG